MVFTGLFGFVNVNQTWFIVLFIAVFIILDVFYSLRDISFWGMIPALSEDSQERALYTSLGSFGASLGFNGLTVIVVPWSPISACSSPAETNRTERLDRPCAHRRHARHHFGHVRRVRHPGTPECAARQGPG